jgi:hypothetical protein
MIRLYVKNKRTYSHYEVMLYDEVTDPPKKQVCDSQFKLFVFNFLFKTIEIKKWKLSLPLNKQLLVTHY